MPDNDDLTDGERFQTQVAARPHVNQLKGAGALDWGMQSRLARIFDPGTNRTVMLAIDHGYFQGPTTDWSGSTCPSCRCSGSPTR